MIRHSSFGDTDRVSNIEFRFTILEHSFHTLMYDLFPDICFIYRDIEDELIMDLEDHLSSEFLIADFRIYIEHSVFEHISSSSLDRHIYSFSLTSCTYHLIRVPKSWYISPSPKGSLHVSLLSSLFEDLLIVGLHSRISHIESIDILLRFPWRRTECLREPESSDPIDHSEVHCLRDTSLVWCDKLLL